MARALWKGSLAFGLVSIPIELHVAVRDHRPRFRMLHAADHSPVNFTRVCAREGRPVAWADLVKGYEYSKGHFVILTKDDFRRGGARKTHRIDILDFVTASEIDDRFFETRTTWCPARAAITPTRCCGRRCARRNASASRPSSFATPASHRRRSHRRRAGPDPVAICRRAREP